jgi:UDP-glucose 4-epimerase
LCRPSCQTLGVMRVLITGSSGRVGRAIYVRLHCDHEVVGIDRSPSSTANIVGNLADIALLRGALRGVDAVVHTAALHAPHVGIVHDSEFESVNVQATHTFANLAAEARVSRFVFTSTTALYGTASTPRHTAGWVDEDLEPQPESVYHRTKLGAETLLEAMSREGKLAVTVLRMSRCFPEPAPIMAAYRLHRGVDARDIADAHALALQTTQPGFRRFVVSGATPFKAEDAHDLLRDAPLVLKHRAPELVEAFARRRWSLPKSIDRVYSPALAMQELGWRPRYGFTEVLKMLDEESSEVLPPRHSRSTQERSSPTGMLGRGGE